MWIPNNVSLLCLFLLVSHFRILLYRSSLIRVRGSTGEGHLSTSTRIKRADITCCCVHLTTVVPSSELGIIHVLGDVTTGVDESKVEGSTFCSRMIFSITIVVDRLEWPYGPSSGVLIFFVRMLLLIRFPSLEWKVPRMIPGLDFCSERTLTCPKLKSGQVN